MKEVNIKVKLDAKDANKESEKLKKTLNDIDEIDIESPFDEIYGDAKSLTQVMGGLQDRLYELAKAGKTNTKEFKALTKETGRLRQAQIKVDRAVDATAKTLGEKLADGANLAASGYAIVQGAMGAMNIENEEVEKSLQRVMSAMAIAQGVSSFTTALQGTTIGLKAVAAAQWLWNIALKANPIGLVLGGVTALIGGFKLLTNWMSKNTDEADAQADAQAELENKIKLTNISINNQVASSNLNRLKSKETTDQLIKEAAARGATAEEIRNMEKASMDNSIAKSMETISVLVNTRALNLETNAYKRSQLESKKARLESDGTTYDERTRLRNEIQSLENDLLAPNAEEDTLTYQIGQQNIVLDGLLSDRTDMINRHKVAIIGEDTKAQSDARPKVQGLEGVDTQGFSGSDDGNALFGMFSATQEGLDSELQMFSTHIENINDLYAKNKDAKLSADEEKMASDIAIAQSLQYGFDVAAGLAKQDSDLQKAILIAKQAAAAVELGLSIKSTIMAAKETAAKASLKASEAAVDAGTGAIKTAASAPFPANLPLIIGYAASAAGIMSGVISATKKSQSTASRYGGGGTGGSVTETPQAPAFNLVEGSEGNSIQQSIEGQGNQPLKAYVVSGEITSQASLDRQIQDSSSI